MTEIHLPYCLTFIFLTTFTQWLCGRGLYPVKDERWNTSLAMHMCSHLDLQGIL